MTALLIIIAIPVVLALAIVGWAIATYNSFVSLRELVRNAMGKIAAQIESRWDAISSLINAVRRIRVVHADEHHRATPSADRSVLGE